jgi:hypothetical protein
MNGGEWILAIGALVLLAGLAYGLFTRTGSGIAPRPWGTRGGAGGHPGSGPQAGAQGPEEVTGRDEGDAPPVDYGTR